MVGPTEIEDIGPGETRDLTWTFTSPVSTSSPVTLPSHFESGMVLEIQVTG